MWGPQKAFNKSCISNRIYFTHTQNPNSSSFRFFFFFKADNAAFKDYLWMIQLSHKGRSSKGVSFERLQLWSICCLRGPPSLAGAGVLLKWDPPAQRCRKWAPTDGFSSQRVAKYFSVVVFFFFFSFKSAPLHTKVVLQHPARECQATVVTHLRAN